MPDKDQFQYVKMPDGSYGKFRADASDDVIRSTILKDFPDAYGPHKPSLWEAANKPVGKDVNETYQGLNRKMDDWIAMHAPEGTPSAVLRAVTQGVNLPADIIGAVTEAGRETLSPLGVATLGLASK